MTEKRRKLRMPWADMTDPKDLHRMLEIATKGVSDVIAENTMLRKYVALTMNMRLQMGRCGKQCDTCADRQPCEAGIDALEKIEQTAMRRLSWDKAFEPLIPPAATVEELQLANYDMQQRFDAMSAFCIALFGLRSNTRDCLTIIGECKLTEEDCPNADHCRETREFIMERLELGAAKFAQTRPVPEGH